MSVPQPRIDPRVEKTRAAVWAATSELLAEVGMAGLTMEGIAERAGIGRSTLYRHWDEPRSIVHEAIASRPAPRPDQLDHEDPIATIAAILEHLVEAMADTERSSMALALAHAADSDDAVAEAFHADNGRRRARLTAAIDAATESGALDPSTNAATGALALAGAVTYARAMMPTPMTADEIPSLMRQVLGVDPGDQAQPSRSTSRRQRSR